MKSVSNVLCIRIEKFGWVDDDYCEEAFESVVLIL